MKAEGLKDLARRRAEVILAVRSGKMTAKEGAQALGVSRKTYYEWEERALSGMMEALMDRPAGRPKKKSKPKEKSEEEKELTEAILRLSEQIFLEEQLSSYQKMLEAYPGLARLTEKAADHEKKMEPPPG